MKNQKPDNTQQETPKTKRFKTVQRNVVFYQQQVDYLETAAKILQCSQAEVIRQAIDEHKQNHKQDLLEQLGSQIEDMTSLKEILAAEPENYTVAEWAEYVSKNGRFPK